MFKKNIKGGLYNPLNCKNVKFEYEVEWQGEVKNVEYEDEYSKTYTQPECPVLLKSISGSHGGNSFYCTICGDDALKTLRECEIISAELNFIVKKDDNGNYMQKVTIFNLFTLNDYYQIREAEALYKGRYILDWPKTD